MARTRKATCNCCGASVRKGSCIDDNCQSHAFFEINARQTYRHRVLAAMPGTIKQLAERALVSRSTAQAWVAVLFCANECHTMRGKSHGGRPATIYAAGPTRK